MDRDRDSVVTCITALQTKVVDRPRIAILRLAMAIPLLAASPSPTAAPGGDPRSSGQGPGLVGDPLLALLVVLAIGVAALALTLAYIHLTRTRVS
jgi:hypothetical protein